MGIGSSQELGLLENIFLYDINRNGSATIKGICREYRLNELRQVESHLGKAR